MERIKGMEEDSKKFLILTNQSSHLQLDYEMVRPLVKRTLKYKGGPELVKMFEQLRKNAKPNLKWQTATKEQ